MLWRRFSLLAVVALALVTSGVHRAPSLDPAQFVSGPFGLPMVICGPGASESGHPTTACETCTFAVGLPAPSPSPVARCASLTALLAPVSDAQTTPTPPQEANTARAPPVLI